MAKITSREELADLVRDAVHSSEGNLDAELRRAVTEAARATVCGTDPPTLDDGTLAAFSRAVAADPRHADLGALLADGHDEDAVFELTLCAAVGAGRARLEAGLAALREGGDT